MSQEEIIPTPKRTKTFARRTGFTRRNIIPPILNSKLRSGKQLYIINSEKKELKQSIDIDDLAINELSELAALFADKCSTVSGGAYRYNKCRNTTKRRRGGASVKRKRNNTIIDTVQSISIEPPKNNTSILPSITATSEKASSETAWEKSYRYAMSLVRTAISGMKTVFPKTSAAMQEKCDIVHSKGTAIIQYTDDKIAGNSYIAISILLVLISMSGISPNYDLITNNALNAILTVMPSFTDILKTITSPALSLDTLMKLGEVTSRLGLHTALVAVGVATTSICGRVIRRTGAATLTGASMIGNALGKRVSESVNDHTRRIENWILHFTKNIETHIATKDVSPESIIKEAAIAATRNTGYIGHVNNASTIVEECPRIPNITIPNIPSEPTTTLETIIENINEN